MQNNLVTNFKKQLTANIYRIAFSSAELWQDHLNYMICNHSQSWINILSIYNSRSQPLRVLRIEEWRNELGISPTIISGSSGIPLLINDTGKIEKIVHDGWDISDFIEGKNFSLSSSFFNDMNHLYIKHSIKHEYDFWLQYIDPFITGNHFLFQADQKTKDFFLNSLLFAITGETTIPFTIITEKKEDIQFLCELYQNILLCLNDIISGYHEYVKIEEKRMDQVIALKVALTKSKRKLPERLDDAERKLKYIRKGITTEFDQGDNLERSKLNE